MGQFRSKTTVTWSNFRKDIDNTVVTTFLTNGFQSRPKRFLLSVSRPMDVFRIKHRPTRQILGNFINTPDATFFQSIMNLAKRSAGLNVDHKCKKTLSYWYTIDTNVDTMSLIILKHLRSLSIQVRMDKKGQHANLVVILSTF